MATPDHTADAARNSTTTSDANPGCRRVANLAYNFTLLAWIETRTAV